ncbi:MAG: DUF4920 domain-containing protein [Crocinitomicaceae bacterium]|nr:DUF4920 domain-containing protein [Crocinitomicaceae bacterium]
MKSITLFVATALLLVSCGSAELGESYGPFEVNVDDAMSVEEMLTAYEGQTEEMEFTFEGTLKEVCSKAGCWVNIDKGNGETFMVRFKDHFTIPPATEIDNGAYFHGLAHWDTVSVELLQHFAEDAGKSAEEIALITEPKFELGFEADGITLKK